MKPEAEVEHALFCFFRAMRAWEEACIARYKAVKSGDRLFAEVNAENIADLKRLHEQLCTTDPSAMPERNGTFRMRPEYDAEGEKIIEVRCEGDEAKVYTEQTTVRPSQRCVYTLRRTNSGWRVVDNRMRFTPSGDLTAWPL